MDESVQQHSCSLQPTTLGTNNQQKHSLFSVCFWEGEAAQQSNDHQIILKNN